MAKRAKAALAAAMAEVLAAVGRVEKVEAAATVGRAERGRLITNSVIPTANEGAQVAREVFLDRASPEVMAHPAPVDFVVLEAERVKVEMLLRFLVILVMFSAPFKLAVPPVPPVLKLGATVEMDRLESTARTLQQVRPVLVVRVVNTPTYCPLSSLEAEVVAALVVAVERRAPSVALVVVAEAAAILGTREKYKKSHVSWTSTATPDCF